MLFSLSDLNLDFFNLISAKSLHICEITRLSVCLSAHLKTTMSITKEKMKFPRIEKLYLTEERGKKY